MSSTHFAPDGALYHYDDNERQIIKDSVRYADTNKTPGETPFLPDIEFQQKFNVSLNEALREAKKLCNYEFIFDKSRIAGFDGLGFFNGDLTAFMVRADKPLDANFRVEFRASMMVPFFKQDQRNGMKNRIISEILAVDKKEG